MIKESGYQWMTLGKMTLAGRSNMERIKVDIDSRLLSLPTEA